MEDKPKTLAPDIFKVNGLETCERLERKTTTMDLSSCCSYLNVQLASTNVNKVTQSKAKGTREMLATCSDKHVLVGSATQWLESG